MSDLMPVIEGYDLLEVLGRGAFGDVYRARHCGLRREVALKLLAVIDTIGPEEIARCHREIEIQKDLRHPGLVRLLDAGLWSSGIYLALELVEGGSVQQRIRAGGLKVAQAVDIVQQTARGLEYLHQGGIVHRDLKPANLMISAEGRIKIGDYGLARGSAQTLVTMPGSLLGSPGYMAPEALSGAQLGPPADVYSLGVIFHELVTGRLPHSAPTLPQLMALVISSDPAPARTHRPDTPPWIDELIGRCLARSASRRIQLDELIRLLDERTPATGIPRDVSHKIFLPASTATLEEASSALASTGRSDPGTPVRRSGRGRPAVLLPLGVLLVFGAWSWSTSRSPVDADRTLGNGVISVSPEKPVEERSPAECWKEFERRRMELRKFMWSSRGAEVMQAKVASSDRDSEDEIIRRYRRIVDLAFELLGAVESAPPDRVSTLHCGMIFEYIVDLRHLVFLTEALPVVDQLNAQLARRFAGAREDLLLEAVLATLRPQLVDAPVASGSRLVALERLLPMLQKSEPSIQELEYMVLCLDEMILATDGLDLPRKERRARANVLRLRQIETVAGARVPWPGSSEMIRLAFKSIFRMLAGKSTDVERVKALRLGITLCPDLSGRLPDDPELGIQISMLKRILRPGSELTGSVVIQPPRKELLECLGKVDTGETPESVTLRDLQLR